MSFRSVFPTDEAFAAWVRQVNDAIDQQQRAQPVFGPSLRIGNIELQSVTVGTTVHLIAVNVLTGATATIV